MVCTSGPGLPSNPTTNQLPGSEGEQADDLSTGSPTKPSGGEFLKITFYMYIFGNYYYSIPNFRTNRPQTFLFFVAMLSKAKAFFNRVCLLLPTRQLLHFLFSVGSSNSNSHHHSTITNPHHLPWLRMSARNITNWAKHLGKGLLPLFGWRHRNETE